MSRKIYGVTVGTPIDPQALIERTTQAQQIEQNTQDIVELSEQIAYLMGEINEVAELLGGNA